MCSPIDPNPPVIPKRLLESPFTEDDEVIREFEFQNEISFHRDVQVDWKVAKVSCCKNFWLCIPFSPLWFPLVPVWRERKQEQIRVNKVEELWKRHLAVNKQGILYKEAATRPMDSDPTNCWTDICWKYEQHEALERGGTAKTIPFDKIQDVRVKEARGAEVVEYCCCGAESFKYADERVDVDGVGRHIELIVYGIKHSDHFRKTVLALKHGKPLPDLPQDWVSTQEDDTSKLLQVTPPSSVEMSRKVEEGEGPV